MPARPSLGLRAVRTFPTVLHEDDRTGFADFLVASGVADKRSSAKNLSDLVWAWAECDDPTFGVPELALCGPEGPIAAPNLRHWIGKSKAHEKLERLRLRAVPESKVVLLRVEHEIGGTPQHPMAYLGLQAVGVQRGVLLDVRRVELDVDDEQVTNAVRDMLEHFVARSRAHRVGTHALPLVALDPRLGEWRNVRDAVGSVVNEYAMTVTGDYGEPTFLAFMRQRRPHEGRLSGGLIWRDDEPVARPQRIRRPGAEHNEYFCGYRIGDTTVYTVVRPIVNKTRMRSGALETRAVELTGLLSTLRAPTLLAAIGAERFTVRNDADWRRAVLAAGTFHAFISSLFDDRVDSRQEPA